jgi:hypothetical protein
MCAGVRITLGIDRPDVAIFPVLGGRMRRRLAPPRRDKLKAHGHETSGAFFACDAFHRRREAGWPAGDLSVDGWCCLFTSRGGVEVSGRRPGVPAGVPSRQLPGAQAGQSRAATLSIAVGGTLLPCPAGW